MVILARNPDFRWGRGLVALLSAALSLGCQGQPRTETVEMQPVTSTVSLAENTEAYRGVVVSADQIDDGRISVWRQQKISVALLLTGLDQAAEELAAAKRIVEAGLELEYFIEVAHCPQMAQEHPEWMASLQGHEEWRRLFPGFPKLEPKQVVKVEPWVPILYRESFEAHLKRVESLLKEKPPAKRIWLNDLQAAPSACGCGHPLCRWTTDYGPIKTATPLDADAAANFVIAVRNLVPGVEVTPVFAPECEADDQHETCGGVGCYEGACWKEWTKQLDAIGAAVETVGAACFYKEFDRDHQRYGDEAAWVKVAVESFAEMPKIRKGKGVPSSRLVAVLQGWEVTEEQVNAQVTQAKSAGTQGWLIVKTPLDQSWTPRRYSLQSKSVVVDELEQKLFPID
jgi:hypothetical protein